MDGCAPLSVILSPQTERLTAFAVGIAAMELKG